MSYYKKHLSIFLCILLAFTTVFFASPQDTKAASKITLSSFVTSSTFNEICIAKGEKNFYAGDLVDAYRDYPNYKYYGFLSMLSGVTYKSSKSSVASINSKTGKINAKKTGTTTITIKYSGQEVKFKLKVINSKDLKKKLPVYVTSDMSDLEECANIFLNQVGDITKITTANRYDILTAYKIYDYKSSNGLTSIYESVSGSYKHTYYLYSPKAAHAYATCNALSQYSSVHSPFATSSSKCFKVKSISGKGNTNKIKVNLKNKVTEDQIFGGNYYLSWESDIEKSGIYTFPIRVKNMKNNYYYYAIATVKKGSTTMTIETKNLKLKKGTNYKLIAQYGSWLDGSINKNTFKAN